MIKITKQHWKRAPVSKPIPEDSKNIYYNSSYSFFRRILEINNPEGFDNLEKAAELRSEAFLKAMDIFRRGNNFYNFKEAQYKKYVDIFITPKGIYFALINLEYRGVKLFYNRDLSIYYLTGLILEYLNDDCPNRIVSIRQSLKNQYKLKEVQCEHKRSTSRLPDF